MHGDKQSCMVLTARPKLGVVHSRMLTGMTITGLYTYVVYIYI